MIASPQFNYLSHTEYLHIEEQSDLKHEYLDGEVYAMAGASDRHVTIAGNLFAVLWFMGAATLQFPKLSSPDSKRKSGNRFCYYL